MADVTVNRIGEAVQADNEARFDYLHPSQIDAPVRGKLTAADIRAYGLVGGLFWLVVSGFAWLLKVITCWNVSAFHPSLDCTLSNGFAWIATFSPVGIGVAFAAVEIWRRYTVTQSEAMRARITRDRYLNPVDSAAVVLQTSQQQRYYFDMAQQAEIATAPYKQLPSGLDSLSISGGNGAGKVADVLAAPQSVSDALRPVPASEWLEWINKAPHLMLAGRTDAGKTTLAQAILIERVLSGDEIYVIDPHDQPRKWLGIDAVGGGRNYDEVLSTLDVLLDEMDKRYKEYDNGKDTAEFTRLTVFVDEVPSIMTYCTEDGPQGSLRRWKTFVKSLGSEARKVRMSVILMTQSHLVQDIGANTAMRENFTRVALGDKSRPLLSEETDKQRKEAMIELLRGQQYTATIEYRNDFYVLDTADVPALASRDVVGKVKVWHPPQQPQQLDDSAAFVELPQPKDNAKRDAIARRLFEKGHTFRAVAGALRHEGYTIDNKRLSELYQEVNG